MAGVPAVRLGVTLPDRSLRGAGMLVCSGLGNHLRKLAPELSIVTDFVTSYLNAGNDLGSDWDETPVFQKITRLLMELKKTSENFVSLLNGLDRHIQLVRR